MLLITSESSVYVLIGMSLLLGFTNGFSGFANQATLYVQTPADEIAVASGLYRTFGYIGAIFSSSLIGITFGRPRPTQDCTLSRGCSAGSESRCSFSRCSTGASRPSPGSRYPLGITPLRGTHAPDSMFMLLLCAADQYAVRHGCASHPRSAHHDRCPDRHHPAVGMAGEAHPQVRLDPAGDLPAAHRQRPVVHARARISGSRPRARTRAVDAITARRTRPGSSVRSRPRSSSPSWSARSSSTVSRSA